MGQLEDGNASQSVEDSPGVVPQSVGQLEEMLFPYLGGIIVI